MLAYVQVCETRTFTYHVLFGAACENGLGVLWYDCAMPRLSRILASCSLEGFSVWATSWLECSEGTQCHRLRPSVWYWSAVMLSKVHVQSFFFLLCVNGASLMWNKFLCIYCCVPVNVLRMEAWDFCCPHQNCLPALIFVSCTFNFVKMQLCFRSLRMKFECCLCRSHKKW